ncbi:hypothetical protein ASE82_17065 [Sphingomonas sp. Leaf230]|uniref:hypothetical protein n=1 Tax=Sphingomonas sp. Leaf230 TaxID=1735694 RepID=UPI0006FB3252|nr:hypothetical protein [Sphingomonas sp. Leaf230]KQN01181.1 hypothetical protein ASE82_17065 [Sphingomonas sp. Leaf230]
MDPTLVCPLEQRRHLRGRQPDHAVVDTWRRKIALLEPFIISERPVAFHQPSFTRSAFLAYKA